MRRVIRIIFLFFVLIVGVILISDSWTSIQERAVRKISGRRYTVADRLTSFGTLARSSIRPDFERVGLQYPPKRLILIGLKTEKILELYVSDGIREYVHIKSYPILAASGSIGPKLREGDMQVPEGVYQIESLNPNSHFHLSLRVNYPNEFDREQARIDGRAQLGGDIMIHGSQVSVGCLAIGDQAIEELFVLAADTGLENIKVILSPVDFRQKGLQLTPAMPYWTPKLYEKVREQLQALKKAKYNQNHHHTN